jgi:hypothetical protein
MTETTPTIQDNMNSLKAKANSLDMVFMTQVSCTRTRGLLLQMKKMTDMIRKQLLAHVKDLKTKKSTKTAEAVPKVLEAVPEAFEEPLEANAIPSAQNSPEAQKLKSILKKPRKSKKDILLD